MREKYQKEIEHLTDLDSLTMDSIEAMCIIDKIYDDFENHTCENCKNYRPNTGECFPLNMRVNTKFGCILFVSTDTKSH